MPERPGKFVRESVSEYTEFALPTDANPLGNVLGGKVMHLVDLAGAMAAIRHARCHVVTASIDYMTFLHPIHIGSLVILRSSVNRVFRSSMEVGVRVEMEDLRTGRRRHASSAYLTFVAIDEAGKPVPVTPAIPETAEEIKRYEQAEQRRLHRLELRDRARKREEGQS